MFDKERSYIVSSLVIELRSSGIGSFIKGLLILTIIGWGLCGRRYGALRLFRVGMAMGRTGNGFYLPRIHTLLPFTYRLPCPYPTGMRNWISSPSPTGSSIPALYPFPTVDIFLIKIKVFFNPERNLVMHYPEKRWQRSMTMVMEKREVESVRYGRR